MPTRTKSYRCAITWSTGHCQGKEILGRTASLEVRLVDDTLETRTKMTREKIPPDTELMKNRERGKACAKKRSFNYRTKFN